MEDIDNATALSPITQPRIRGRPLRAVWAFLRAAIRAERSRRELARMNDHLFADIGICRADALMESTRKPWDVNTPPDPTRRSRGR